MRRNDRAVTDPLKIRGIIENSEVLRVGYCDNGEVYIVPVNFGFTETDGGYTFYFHGASAGRKYELSKNSCAVGFELESESTVVVNEEIACRSTCSYRSVIGNGTVSLIDDPAGKVAALNIILGHFTGKPTHNFDEKMLRATAVFKLDVEKLSCKERLF